MFDVGIDPQEETAMLAQVTDRKIYELLLIGLSWLRLDNPSKLDRTCASVVRAMCYAKVLPVG